ncbi:MAG: SLBB domain-containing protein, partial [Bacteroidota bacterium]
SLSNQRVIVFPGRGQAVVITLQNINTTLLEVIAMAGGITNDGLANSIKIMRRNKNGKRSIFKIDLSTIDGIKQAEMIVQSNDYIYIDYKPRIASGILTELAPWISLFSTSLTLFAIFLRL